MQYWDILMPDSVHIGGGHKHRSFWLRSIDSLRRVGSAHRATPDGTLWGRLRRLSGAVLHFLLESFLEVRWIFFFVVCCCTLHW